MPTWKRSEETATDPEENRVLYAALDSFYQYGKVAHYNTTHTRRQSFYALPRSHVQLLSSPPFSYLETLNAVDDGIDENAKLASAILNAGLASMGLSTPNSRGKSNPEDPNDWRGKATLSDLEKARSTLRQLYRDWSAEAASEREACYGPVIRALQAERTARSGASMSILVPGAGIGRLVFELCCLGFDTEGNEISWHQLLASSYILNVCPEEKLHTLYPWVHSFSNHRSRANHLRSVRVPDVLPGKAMKSIIEPGQMSMVASDFLLLYSGAEHKDAFDAVATVFFLDTAPNIIRYIQAIKSCLKPRGLLVNIGPLLWHFENTPPGANDHGEHQFSGSETQGIGDPGSVELTDDEVVMLVEALGFTIEHRESGIAAPYIQDSEGMLHNTYLASHWVARKK